MADGRGSTTGTCMVARRDAAAPWRVVRHGELFDSSTYMTCRLR